MTTTIPSLWPDINVDLVPPLTILRAQASRLGQLTKGILEAEVTTVTGDTSFVVHRLDLIAPSLDDRRVRILSATHREDYYPVVLEAECYRPKNLVVADVKKQAMEILASKMGIDTRTHIPTRDWPIANGWRPIAADQDEFIQRVGDVLRSMEVRSAIDSMIALSNQKSEAPEASKHSSNGAPVPPDSGNEEVHP